jgi:hypothetical protein
MTEAEWLACDDLQAMLRSLHGNWSARKQRLFGCACCRSLDDVLVDAEVRKALDAAERFADGLIALPTVMKWFRRACAARDTPERLPREGEFLRNWMAYHAVAVAALANTHAEWTDAPDAVAQAVAHGSGHQRGSQAWKAEYEKALRGRIPLLRDVVGNTWRRAALAPGWLAWSEGIVTRLALGIYEDRAFDRTPILADALEDAGCTDDVILSHLRGPGPHVRGCWAIDLLLGKV